MRGVNVFPTSVQRVEAEAGDPRPGSFASCSPAPGPYDASRCEWKLPPEMPPESWPGAAAELARRVRAAIGASAEVTMLPFEALPRTEGKTRLVEREPS